MSQRDFSEVSEMCSDVLGACNMGIYLLTLCTANVWDKIEPEAFKSLPLPFVFRGDATCF